MLVGPILMLIGVLLVIANKEIADGTGIGRGGYFDQFWGSGTRQSIAVVGFLLALGGSVVFLLW